MVDAHVHVWTLDPERFPWQQTLARAPILERAAHAEDLITEMDASGVEIAVLVPRADPSTGGNVNLRVPARYYCRYPFEDPRGLVEDIEELDSATTAFMLVYVYGRGFDLGDPIPDVPPLFLRDLHPLQAEMMRERIRPSLDAARAAALKVVYVENNWRHGAWGQSEFGEVVRRSETGHLGEFDDLYVGSPTNDYSEVIAPGPHDVMVQKTMYDGFFETTLDAALRNMGIKNLVCVGFCADICLLHTVVGAMYHNYRVIVLRDCTLAAEFADTFDGLNLTKTAIRYYESLVGLTSTSDQFISACNAPREPALATP
jgi:nicotinamidase-related amidase